MGQKEVALLEKRLTHLQSLRESYMENLAILEKQEAGYGFDIPLQIINNIANTQKKLADIARERTTLSQELGGFKSARRTIGTSDLYRLVQQELEIHVERRDTFTAYDITLALRTTYPSIQIIHTSVRESVHQQMQQPIT